MNTRERGMFSLMYSVYAMPVVVISEFEVLYAEKLMLSRSMLLLQQHFKMLVFFNYYNHVMI